MTQCPPVGAIASVWLSHPGLRPSRRETEEPASEAIVYRATHRSFRITARTWLPGNGTTWVQGSGSAWPPLARQSMLAFARLSTTAQCRRLLMKLPVAIDFRHCRDIVRRRVAGWRWRWSGAAGGPRRRAIPEEGRLRLLERRDNLFDAGNRAILGHLNAGPRDQADDVGIDDAGRHRRGLDLGGDSAVFELVGNALHGLQPLLRGGELGGAGVLSRGECRLRLLKFG